MEVVLYVAVTVVALMIIGLILIQPSKGGGGLGGSFGGGGDSVFGAQTSGHLSKLTVILVSIFFLLVLTLAIVGGRKESTDSLIDEQLSETSEAVDGSFVKDIKGLSVKEAKLESKEKKLESKEKDLESKDKKIEAEATANAKK